MAREDELIFVLCKTFISLTKFDHDRKIAELIKYPDLVQATLKYYIVNKLMGSKTAGFDPSKGPASYT